MTGFINSAGDRLSAVSVAAMGDVGYTVNVGNAELYSLPLLAAVQSAPVALGDDVLRLPLVEIDDYGRVVRRVR
jgi:hypothetical protein